MVLAVVVVGLVVLVILAVLIGVLEATALRAAWGQIAVARRRNNERARRLRERETTLEDRQDPTDWI